MTDRELLYVKTVAEEKNITRAAEKLLLAQPSLTQSIQRIEKSLNCLLFYRQKSGFILTEAGKLYYKTACEILGAWQQLEEGIRRIRGLEQGSLRIGGSWYNTLLILNDILPVFNSRFPDIGVKLTESNSAELEELLATGKLDVILTHQYPPEYTNKTASDSKRFSTMCILKENFLAVVPERFSPGGAQSARIRNGKRPCLDLQSVASVPFIRFRENQRIRHISDFILEQAGIHPPETISTYGFPSAYEMARNGLGITFLPEKYLMKISKRSDGVRLFALDSRYSAYWIASVSYYQADPQPSAVLSFLDIIREFAVTDN